MLKSALCGSYVNFGVFRLYGDEALDNALNTFVELLLSIPQSDLLVSTWPIMPSLLSLGMQYKLLLLRAFRNIPSYRRPITFCWNAWHKIT